MSARTIELVEAIKEVFDADPGPLQLSVIAKRIQARHPGEFVLDNAYFRHTLSTLVAGGYLVKPEPNSFQKV